MSSEVETILNEIRERVRATERERAGGSIAVQDESSHNPVTPAANGNSPQSESLARVSAHLMTTSRAWDRLPPVLSNRSGLTARLELWIKARFKSLANWFTWEQVNFNAAVHHSLSEMLAAIAVQEQQLRALRAELRREAESRQAGFERNERDLQALRAAVELQAAVTESRAGETSRTLEKIKTSLLELTAASARLSEQVEESVRPAQHAADVEARLAQQVADVDARLSTQASDMNERFTAQAETVSEQLSDLAAEISSRLSGLATEIAQVSNDLREEQRVCFKQLSLEASEAAVLEDRGRRAIESRLGKLEKRDRH